MRAPLVIAALLAAALVAPAADGAVRIRTVDASTYPTIRVAITATGPVRGAPRLREGGRPVAALDVHRPDAARSIVVAIDRSQSMRGRALSHAIAAGRALAAAKRADDRIAVVGFGAGAATLSDFSADAEANQRTIGELRVDRREGTALNDAIVLGAGLLAREGRSRVLVVVTDGRDTTSVASARAAVAAARQADVAVYSLAVGSADVTPRSLRRLARETGGTDVAATSGAELERLAAAIPADLRRLWRATYTTAARPGERVALRATVPGSGSTRAVFRLPATGTAAASAPSRLLPSAAYTSPWGPAVVAAAVGLLLLGAALAVMRGRRAGWARRRLAAHVPGEERSEPERARRSLPGIAAVLRSTEGAFGHMRWFARVERLLERADLKLRPAELVYVSTATAFLAGLLVAVTGRSTFLILLALVVGFVAPLAFVRSKAKRRVRAFDDQLPDLLLTVAASLKAGHSFRQSIHTVATDGGEPGRKEFERVLGETRLGRSVDDALAEMAKRLGSRNLEFVVASVTIQRQVGGSLAGLFEMVADTVRDRQQFARKIRGLTAMGRASAYVLVGLPFVLSLVISLINPGYLDPLLYTPAGRVMVIGTLMSIALGALVLKKIVSFKV